MVKRINYPGDFSKVIHYLKLQIFDSVKQLEKDFPRGSFKNAKEIWEEFKPRLRYENDPANAELFQCYETLFYRNYHGRPGSGDCDCFSILSAAAAISSGLPYKIVLASRYREAPIHIYTEVQKCVIDFTRNEFNSKRFYPYIQKFAF